MVNKYRTQHHTCTCAHTPNKKKIAFQLRQAAGKGSDVMTPDEFDGLRNWFGSSVLTVPLNQTPTTILFKSPTQPCIEIHGGD